MEGEDVGMYKLLLLPIVLASHMWLIALQMDEMMAMQVMFKAKYSLNYAVHAAAQQLDPGLLAQGVHSISVEAAQEMAELYLQENMMLDSQFQPLPTSYLRSRVETTVFKVINDDQLFPYTYIHTPTGFQTTLERPGVIMILKVEYPRTFNVLGPITWDIKGSAELVY